MSACSDEPTGGGRGPRERWYREHAGEARPRPAVLGTLVYFATGDGFVVARDTRTGAEGWRGQAGHGEGVQGANLVARAGVVMAPAVGA